MNQYEAIARQAASEITRLWAQMRTQASNPAGEDYPARVARADTRLPVTSRIREIGVLRHPLKSANAACRCGQRQRSGSPPCQ